MLQAGARFGYARIEARTLFPRSRTWGLISLPIVGFGQVRKLLLWMRMKTKDCWTPLESDAQQRLDRLADRVLWALEAGVRLC